MFDPDFTITPAPLSQAAAFLTRAFRAAQTRRQLAAMDDRMLSDIGISRLDALAEAGRAPWDLASPDRRRPRLRLVSVARPAPGSRVSAR